MRNYVLGDRFVEWKDVDVLFSSNIVSFLLKTDGTGETEGHNFSLEFYIHSIE